MTQSFRCTNCAAPLEIENDFSAFIRCDYCGVTSSISSPPFSNGHFQNDLMGETLLNQARKLKEIKQLALAGNQLAAIKLYRETFSAGLAESKQAVDNILAGKPLVFTSVQTFPAQNFSSNISENVSQALKIAEIQRLVQSGNKIQAIKVYRETFGTGLKESKDAVEAMEHSSGSEKIAFANTRGNAFAPSSAKYSSHSGKSGGSFAAKLLMVVVLIFIGTFAAIYLITNALDKRAQRQTSEIKTPPLSPVAPSVTKTKEEKPQFAREIFKFGGEGVGAGLFKDNRAIAIDADGQIYSADFSGGRIQVFDSNGKFQTQIMSDTTRPIRELAIDRKGNLYVLHGSDLFRYNLKNTEDFNKTRIEYASDIAVGLDGKIYVSTRMRGTISVVSPEGKILRTISTANSGLKDILHLAVDGAGNFYAFDSESHSVFKLSPEGKLLTRFGGKGTGSFDTVAPGLFYIRPDDIAVDNKERVYVSENVKINVFSTEGAFLGDFKTTQAFGMAFNEKGELFVATRPFITKYEVKR